LGDHDDEEQVVRAVLVSASTQEELSEPIYFDAYTEEDDEELREALIQLYNSTNGDNWTNNENWCSDKPVHEWYGVSKDGNGEYSIDLSKNHLTGIIDQKFPECVNILIFYSNQLTSLNVSGCTSFTELYCGDNQLTSLDVSGCTNLEELNCGFNDLTSLDVSSCTSLKTLYCFANTSLTSLKISGCTSLENLECQSTKLTSLNLSGHKAIKIIKCSFTEMTSLNVSNCTALKELTCFACKLTSLDVSGCTSLAYLDCVNNKITSIIPTWFSQFNFIHDVRYEYKKVWSDLLEDYVIQSTDKGYGWWYPGEPAKGEHSPD
jgi:Leucine-rich repeat (LRR) protein